MDQPAGYLVPAPHRSVGRPSPVNDTPSPVLYVGGGLLEGTLHPS